MKARRPLVGSVFTAQHCAARLDSAREHQNWQVRHWRPPRSLHRREQVDNEHVTDLKRVWRRCGEHYAACNIIQHDLFGGGSVMV